MPCSLHHGETVVAVPVLAPYRLDLHEAARVHSFGDLAAEERVHATGHDDGVERGVRDEPVHRPAHEELDALAGLHDFDAAVAELLVEVPGERVQALVVVVVGVNGFVGHPRFFLGSWLVPVGSGRRLTSVALIRGARAG